MNEEVNKQLFADFPEITTRQWEEKIKADLKGSDYTKKLVWQTDEGINVNPYYRKEDLESLGYLENLGHLKLRSGAPNGWIICQDIFPAGDLQEANRRIKVALKGGAQAIRIHLKQCPIPNINTLGVLLDGIPLGETELLFEGCLSADSLYVMLYELASSRSVYPSHLKGSLGADPLGKMVGLGFPVASMENIGRLVTYVNAASPGFKVLEVNGALIQNAGSTLVEELAFALAMASDYMAILTSQDIDPIVAQNSLHMSLSTGSNYFMEIAKLRAARILWAKIGNAYGIESSKSRIQIHSTSSEWNMAIYDPYINMLRGTTEAMSAIIGGTDILSVLPFDYPYGRTTDFSDRIARNVQIILREEACFDRVMDPSAGSYYIETLTDSIAEKTWDLFRDVEAKGGFKKTFESGWIQEQVLESRRNKILEFASGKRKILGINTYPNFNEAIMNTLKAREEETEESPGATLTPLQPFRFASMFEEVRIQTERSEKRPRVLLFKYGNPAWATARAAFSGNFFACSGYEIMDPPAFSSIKEGILASKESKADVVVLCSSDDSYAELGPAVYKALKDHSILVVAGYPEDSVVSLQKTGITHFIHIKTNLLETLKEFNTLLL